VNYYKRVLVAGAACGPDRPGADHHHEEAQRHAQDRCEGTENELTITAFVSERRAPSSIPPGRYLVYADGRSAVPSKTRLP
jgi:hypothetical protein